MNRSPLNGRRTPLERRTGLDTSGGGTLRRRAPLPRGTGLAQVAPSPRRARKAHLDVPPATRALLRDRSRGTCEARVATIVGTCTDLATDVHHRQRRRDGGHAITNLVDVCRGCHAWAHANPADARARGLIVSVYEDPATVALAIPSRFAGDYRWVLLSADGGYLIEAQ